MVALAVKNHWFTYGTVFLATQIMLFSTRCSLTFKLPPLLSHSCNFVMPANVENFTRFLFLQFLLKLLSLFKCFIQMYEVLHLFFLLMVIDIISHLLKILLDMFGFSPFAKSLKQLLFSCILISWLKDNFKLRFSQTDWGGQYHKLQPILHDLSIVFRHPCLHTYQQQGRAERKH